jgi:glycosyltransferase involved in cell wall biosynthesis
MEIFCRSLDREKFEVWALAKKHRPDFGAKLRVGLGLAVRHPKAVAKKRLWDSFFLRQPRLEAALGKDHVMVAADDGELERMILRIKPHILHIHYSGRAEAPLTSDAVAQSVPVIVTTNQFEIENTSPNHDHVKRMYFVSRWMLENKAHWAKNDPRAQVMYNLTDPPEASDDLRTELNVPADAFVIGRVGRADPGIHDPISVEAVARMQDERTWFAALNPPQNMIDEARSLGIKHFLAVPATADSVRLSRYYNTIDVLAHARKDGETFGCNIAEAMIHGKPVVTHLTDEMNAQGETCGDGGVVCGKGDVGAYAEALAHYRDDETYYDQRAAAAVARANGEFLAEKLVQRLERDYLELLRPNFR